MSTVACERWRSSCSSSVEAANRTVGGSNASGAGCKGLDRIDLALHASMARHHFFLTTSTEHVIWPTLPVPSCADTVHKILLPTPP